MNNFKHISFLIFGLSLLLSVPAVAQPHKPGLQKKLRTNTSLMTNDEAQLISAEKLKTHVSILASDSFMGRKPFTEGETRTVHYLQQQFIAAGLEPANGNSYLQEVPLVTISTTAAPAMELQSTKNNLSLKDYDDYIIWSHKTDERQSLDNVEVVFAGYGVVAPEYNWNDYEGINVKGKVVIVMQNDPGSWIADTTLFKGKTLTYYAPPKYKYEEAARHGARACLIIHNKIAGSNPFSSTQRSQNISILQIDDRVNNTKYSEFAGWLSGSAANRILIAAGYDSSLLLKANQKGFKAIPLNLKLTTSMSVKATYNKSYNVVSKITGTKHPDEVIIYSAHWDGILGIGKPDNTGDSIYNGALDNASGTAGMLELARVFSKLKAKPERSLLFIAVTAEEYIGQPGSLYYVLHPFYPMHKTVANINLDGIFPYGKTKDFEILGQGQSTLEDYLETEVKKIGGYILPDQQPEQGLFNRSDQLNFAKAGVPAMFAGQGYDIIGKGKEYGRQLREQYIKNVHQTFDEYDPSMWTMEGGVEYLKLIFRVGKRLASERSWPQWKEGSAFKAIRENKN